MMGSCCFLSVESVQTAAEDPAAGQSGPEPEAEDSQRAVRAVCQGDDVCLIIYTEYIMRSTWQACLQA